MSNETTLDDVLALVAEADAWRCTGDEIRCHDGNGCECDMRGVGPVGVHEEAVNYLRAHGAELRAALEDARRYRFVVGRGKLPLKTSQGYHYDYNAPCRTVDAAIDAAQEVG